MSKIYAFLAEGFEEVECLAVADVLKRAGEEVVLVSITDSKEVTGSHGFCVKADCLVGEVSAREADVMFLPGGLPGTNHLKESQELADLLLEADKSGKRIAAICAGPTVLGKLGLLKGKQATCFPGMEEELAGADYTRQGVITDGRITTGRGLGYALDLGLELVGLLQNSDAAAKLKAVIQYDQI